MSWAHYMLQVNIYLVVFYGFYKLLLDKETYFTLNRIYLMSAGLLSFAIPYLRFEWFTKQEVVQPVYISVGQLMGQVSLIQEESDTFSTGNLLVVAYLAGTLFFAVRFLLRLRSLNKKLKHTESGDAFSFFWQKRIDAKLPQTDTVHKHEDAHVRQWHSIDVIFFEILSIITWFNPIIHFYKNAIKSIHEYLADDEAAKFQGDKDEYALLLLSNAFGVPVNTLTNSFFNKSLIKRRVFMLYKQRSRKVAILKYGLFIPLFATALIMSSATIRDNEKIQKITDNIPLDNPLEVVNEVVTATIKPMVPEVLKTELASNKVKHAKATARNKTADNTAITQPLADVQLETTSITSYNQEQDPVHDFVSIDVQPTFVGGMEMFYKYLKDNVKFPEEAKKNNVQGKVFISFIVEKNGALGNFKVERRLGSGTDEEAIRVLEASPKWNPGMLKGKPVRVKYNIPISFTTAAPTTPGQPQNKQGATTPTGKATGIQFADNNGGKIQLRGTPGTDPLVIIDGVPTDMSFMKSLDPNRIEAIHVLKNANATALYGSKGANGVILVTTKVNAGKLKEVNIESEK